MHVRVAAGGAGWLTAQAPLGVVTEVEDQLVPQPTRVTETVPPTTDPAVRSAPRSP